MKSCQWSARPARRNDVTIQPYATSVEVDRLIIECHLTLSAGEVGKTYALASSAKLQTSLASGLRTRQVQTAPRSLQ
jgi:hypothetical protein